MKVDIIIPTYRPDHVFCLLLQKLQEQTFLVHRVILLNTEETLWKKAIEQYPIARLLEELPCPYTLLHIKKEAFDHGGTRNLGAEQSDADVLVFMTQDAVPADAYLIERLVQPFVAAQQRKETDIVAVSYARQLPAEDCRIIERYTRQFNYPECGRKKGRADMAELGIKTFFCSDVCAAYRRDLFLQLGRFETPVIFNEDMFFAARAIMAGYYVAYTADARVTHSHNYSAKQQFRRNFDLAVSQTAHPEIFEQVSSEAEGMKLVKSTMAYLCRIGKPYLIWNLFVQCAAKYAGYFLGKRSHRLTKKQILACTMNPDYWRSVWEEE